MLRNRLPVMGLAACAFVSFATVNVVSGGDDTTVVAGRCDADGSLVLLATSDHGRGEMDRDIVNDGVFVLSSRRINDPMWAYFPETPTHFKHAEPVVIAGQTESGAKRGRTRAVQRRSKTVSSIDDIADACAKIIYVTWVERQTHLNESEVQWTESSLDRQIEKELSSIVRDLKRADANELKQRINDQVQKLDVPPTHRKSFQWEKLELFSTEGAVEQLLEQSKRRFREESELGALRTEDRDGLDTVFRSIFSKKKLGGEEIVTIDNEKLKEAEAILSRVGPRTKKAEVSPYTEKLANAKKAAFSLSEAEKLAKEKSDPQWRVKVIDRCGAADRAYPAEEIKKAMEGMRTGVKSQ